MTATTKARPGARKPVSTIDLPVKASTKILAGTIVCTDASGWAVPATAATGLRPWGKAQATADNTDGSNGDIKVNVLLTNEIWVDLWANDTGTALVAGDRGKRCYMLDNQTLTGDPSGNSPGPYIYEVESGVGVWAWFEPAIGALEDVTASEVQLADAGGLFTATDVEGALAEAKALIDAGMQVSKKTATIAFDNAALAATSGSANGTAAAVNIGTSLPSNSRIVGVDMRALTVFTGGSVSAVTCDVGTSGDVDALIDGADLQTAAVDGGPSSMPLGIRPNKTYASGGQLIATFTPDGSHKLSSLTAGSVVIDVLYVVVS